MSGRPPLHGYNTNYRKKGVVYHVQTEDLGQPICALVTQVFTGGTILAKKRTEYKDILDEDNLEERLRELMQKQHKELLIALRDGSIDTSSVSSVEEKLEKKGGAKPPPPPPNLGKKKDVLRDTVQMELPPEFYEEIVESDSDEDGLIIEDFPPPETPIPSRKTPPKAPKRPLEAPPTTTPIPKDAAPPTIRMTPASFPAAKLPPPVPQDARASQSSAPEAAPETSRDSQPETREQTPSTAPQPPQKPRIFAEISRPAPGLGEEGLGERSLDEVILSYLAEDLQDD